jgi:(4-(4-[2-(gamma-L-glutamylamino)ethyl]phenoxymethyl)furan-2-yl)methanamine synthase
MTRTPGICGDRSSLELALGLDVAERSTRAVVGWDIGGVNIKVARVAHGTGTQAELSAPEPYSIRTAVRPFEIQRHPADLAESLKSLADGVGVLASDSHAVTMTAELSQMFRRKRAGVSFVLDAVAAAFPDADVGVYTTQGRFVSRIAACDDPLSVAAANWTATARVIAESHPTAVIVDIGTTTTDISPVIDGVLCAEGWTDLGRLRSGELLYLGAVRTPVEAITHTVADPTGAIGVSAEGFALAGDVHMWRGALSPAAYSAPTPDGRSVTREFVAERLARVVCADRDALDDSAIDRIADAVAAAQVRRTAEAIARVCHRHPAITTAVVTGVGDFIAGAAAVQAGLSVQRLADAWGPDASHIAPAVAVAVLRSRLIVDPHGAGNTAAAIVT